MRLEVRGGPRLEERLSFVVLFAKVDVAVAEVSDTFDAGTAFSVIFDPVPSYTE